MKRTEIAQLAVNTQIFVCDPYVYSKNPGRAQEATLLGGFFEKDGSHNPVGAYVKVQVEHDNRFVMPNHVVGQASDPVILAAREEAKKNIVAEELAVGQAKDRMDAVLATFSSVQGVTFSLARDARSASISVQDLVKLQVAIQNKLGTPVQEEVQLARVLDNGSSQEKPSEGFVQDVLAHARTNYNEGGWDFVVECMANHEIAEHIAGCKTAKSAIKKMGKVARDLAEKRDEVQKA